MEKTAFDNIVKHFGFIQVLYGSERLLVSKLFGLDLSKIREAIEMLNAIPSENMPKEVSSYTICDSFSSANQAYKASIEGNQLKFWRAQSGWSFGTVNFNQQRGDLLDITYQDLNRFGYFGQTVEAVIDGLEGKNKAEYTQKLCQLALIATQFSLLPCCREVISFTVEYLGRQGLASQQIVEPSVGQNGVSAIN